MSEEIETLHIPFKDWMLKLKDQVAYTYHRPDRPTGATLGDADFVLYVGGKCLHIEFKTKIGKLSASQNRRHAELARCGVTVHVVRELQAAIALVCAWRGMGGNGKPQHEERKPSHDLRVRGSSVFEYRDGALHYVRFASPEDKMRLMSV